MKLSVSLSDQDVSFLDEYALAQGIPSRSAVIQRALELLRAFQLRGAYAEAWSEWETNGDAGLWDAATGDGLTRS